MDGRAHAQIAVAGGNAADLALVHHPALLVRIVRGTGAAPPGAVFLALGIDVQGLPFALVVGGGQFKNGRVGENFRVFRAFAQTVVVGRKAHRGILHFVGGNQRHQSVVLRADEQRGLFRRRESVVHKHRVQVVIQIAGFPALVMVIIPMHGRTEQNIFAEQVGFPVLRFQHAPYNRPHRAVRVRGIGAEGHIFIPGGFGIAANARGVVPKGGHSGQGQRQNQQEQKKFFHHFTTFSLKEYGSVYHISPAGTRRKSWAKMNLHFRKRGNGHPSIPE